jgi:hypothetical protein
MREQIDRYFIHLGSGHTDYGGKYGQKLSEDINGEILHSHSNKYEDAVFWDYVLCSVVDIDISEESTGSCIRPLLKCQSVTARLSGSTSPEESHLQNANVCLHYVSDLEVQACITLINWVQNV